jgi:23S rRNA pseudouridine2605 synthase
MASETRLNKFLAFHTGKSRREIDLLIKQGRVAIDRAVASLGNRVTETARVTIDGSPIQRKSQYTTLLFHKPTGYVCSRKAQGETPTIYALIPPEYHDLKPVGRLDKDSSGLLLLTNDGDLAHSMTHPSFYKQKVYEVTLDTPLQPLHRQMISDHGITLDDGMSKFELERLSDGNDTQWRITMSEGRNRQIRRTFASLGYTVTYLHRTQFGKYAVSQLDGQVYKEIVV